MLCYSSWRSRVMRLLSPLMSCYAYQLLCWHIKPPRYGEWSSKAPPLFPSLAIEIHGACIWYTQLDPKEWQRWPWTIQLCTNLWMLPKGFTNNSPIINNGINIDTINTIHLFKKIDKFPIPLRELAMGTLICLSCC